MTPRLVIQPQTSAELDAYRQAPSQTLLIVGPSGIGKLSVAKYLVEDVLQLAPGATERHQYVLRVGVKEGDKSISIEAARELERFLSLKVPSEQAVHRAIIVEDAHLLTQEAQNALLKTLEEPPAGTIILLTANHRQSLLPTIRSRTQNIEVRRPGRSVLAAYFKELGHDDSAIGSAYAMSGGLPGLMQALLTDAAHPLKAATQEARLLLTQPMLERLITADALSKQRQLAVDTVDMLQQMAHLSLQSATGAAAQRWQKVLRSSYDAADALQANAQPKLALTDMVLRF